MKKILLETSFSKIYMIAMILITLLILGGYFSYAMFTVTKEKSNAISIVTGSLIYKLMVDGSETNILNVPANSSKEFTVVLSNPNNRIARFNFYYIGDLPSNVEMGYLVDYNINTPPRETGINLEKSETNGSSNTYIIKIDNSSSNSVTINLGVSVGLDYNDLELPSNSHLFNEYEGKLISEVLLSSIPKNEQYNDGYDTFIIGENPNNYIWYSGKLWRAVSVNNNAKTTKLVTQWTIGTIPYNNENNNNFKGSHVEAWLNDTTVDGFLGNLRDPDKFIVMDSKWESRPEGGNIGSFKRPNNEIVVTDSVGLLNVYEYQSSFSDKTYKKGYLYNGNAWWVSTPSPSNSTSPFVWFMSHQWANVGYYGYPTDATGLRPSINLKSDIRIIDGKGTEEDPYRLKGDYNINLQGINLNTRYSGEYISFGTGENTLYRIVSHENGTGTKITSAEPLKENGTFKTLPFDSNSNTSFSTTTTMGAFLNGEYLNSGKYLTNEQANMIEENSTWYLGTVGSGASYKLAKYKDTNMSNLATSTKAKVGMLRYGELMSGQYYSYENNITYWTLNKADSSTRIRVISEQSSSGGGNLPNSPLGIKPAFNLKSNVVITSGTGTKQNPFQIKIS